MYETYQLNNIREIAHTSVNPTIKLRITAYNDDQTLSDVTKYLNISIEQFNRIATILEEESNQCSTQS